MKVGFVTPFFSPRAGGSAIAPYYLARQLVRKGHEVFVFTSDVYRETMKFPDEHDLTILQSKCVLASSGFYYSPAMAHSLRENVKGIDVLHLHNFRTYQNIVARNVALDCGLPYVLQAHGSVPRLTKRYSKWLFDNVFGFKILRDASAVIASSQIEVQKYVSMGVDADKLVTIPIGIDTQEFATPPTKGLFRAKYGLKEDTKIILYLGRIDKTKGIDFLLKSYARFRLNATVHATVLVIAGPDDGYMDGAKTLARSLHIDDHVIFTGMLSEYPEKCALVDSDLVVSPCFFESFGMATIEAAATSRAVIVSKGTPMADVVENGHFGMTVVYGDIDDLAEKMAVVIDDSQVRTMLGSNGREFVFANFDWVETTSEYERTYERVMGNLPGRD